MFNYVDKQQREVAIHSVPYPGYTVQPYLWLCFCNAGV